MRRNNISVLLLVLSALVACSSQAPAPETQGNDVATTAEPLVPLGLGKVCEFDNQCAPPPGSPPSQTTGFCVDTVCCDGPCGGGARDNQSCSNVYGVVAGLNPGHCTTLKDGDFCGALVNENPCQWRGAQLNNGNQCPSPKDGDPVHACYTCNPGTCPEAYPVCDGNNNCVACTGDFGSTKTAANPSPCPTAGLPACVDGQCVPCKAGVPGQCTGGCDTSTNTCVACNADFGTTANATTFPCLTQALPSCIAGVCDQCRDDTSTQNKGDCVFLPATPHCNSTTHTCVACIDNSQCSSDATKAICFNNVCTGCASNFGQTPAPSCPTSADPACCLSGNATCSAGECYVCLQDQDCTGNPAGPRCLSNHTCVQCTVATQATDCPANAPLCVGNQCTGTCSKNADCTDPKKPVCDTAVPGGVCVQCTSTNNDCPTLVPANPICLNDTCIQCNTSADCKDPANPICDPTHTCVPCTSDASCAAKDPNFPACDAGKCVQCTSNVTTACSTQKPFCVNDTCVQCIASGQCTSATAPVCVSNSCVGCQNDNGGASPACPDVTLPVCISATGQCVQCNSPDLLGCTDPGKPVCFDTNHVCVECTSNAQCQPPLHVLDGVCDLGSHTCTLGCSSDANCTAPTPKCNLTTNQCVQCTTFNDCSAPTPICNGATNLCVECIIDSQCTSPSKPFCAAGTCVGCDGNLGSGASHACTQPTAPACLTTGPNAGTCVQCTSTDLDACVAPTPVCNDATNKCVQCSSNAQCSGATPICNAAGTCVACDGDLGSGTPAACSLQATPACVKSGPDTGKCVQCTTADHALCVGTTPVCDDTKHVCVACVDNSTCVSPTAICNTSSDTCTVGCSKDADCSGAQPVCKLPQGVCVACTGTETGACTGTTPICNTTNNTCVGCLTGTDCPAATPVCNATTNTCQAGCTLNSDCPASAPICNQATQRCVQCAASSDCKSTTAPICNTSTGTCGTTCSKAAECPGTTPICDPTTKKCVQCSSDSNCPAATPKCNTSTGTCTAQCNTNTDCPSQTPVCDATAHRCVQCTDDSNCPAATPVCNKTSGTCVATCTTNADCPGSIPVCNPSTKQCVQCTDSSSCPSSAPVCNPTTNTCGPATATPDGGTPPRPPVPSATPPSQDDFSVEGGGCACSTVPSSLPSAPALMVGLAGCLTAVLRRRRRAA